MTEPDAAPLARFQSPDVEIAYAEAGPADGELVILLHGFPEFWRGWRNQIAGLATAGFRVVVPDQRGYGSSGKPAGISSYDLDVLAEDVAALARHLGHERFAVVGHDWGASVAWWLATRHPERLSRLVVLNAPHPSVWREAMDGNWRQWLKSLYVRILRLPRLPEAMVRARNFKALADALAPAGLPAEELARYRAAWAEPGALTGMINWYRAFLAKRLPPAASLDIAVPTLVIWATATPSPCPRSPRPARRCAAMRASCTSRRRRIGCTMSRRNGSARWSGTSSARRKAADSRLPVQAPGRLHRYLPEIGSDLQRFDGFAGGRA